MTGRILFFDCETTGLPQDNTPIEYSGNPVPIEVASILCETDEPASRRNIYQTYVGFNDVPCDPFAFRAHGIEEETRQALGMPPEGVIRKVIRDMRLSLAIVGHNIRFDIKLMQIAAYRAGGQALLAELTDAIGLLDIRCTLDLATDICKLPPTPRMQARFPGKAYKPPNLGEAYRFFFGKDFTGAHGALADCLAARDVYYAIIEYKRRMQTQLPGAALANSADGVLQG